MLDFLTFLRENPYPGRGILVGKGRVYYFIMGRSANSRNRVFVKTEDGIRTEAYDPALLTDPSLIIYHPVRRMGDALVVTNGDQTDTICQYGDFRKGLMTRKYEPDDTPETLQRRVMEQAEWKLLPQAAEMISEQIGKEQDNA